MSQWWPTQPEPTLPAFDVTVSQVADATDALLATIDGLDEDDVRRPSLLPGWTRGHVLTHLARNADGLANLALWARDGQRRDMYEGGVEGRTAAIEEGAGRQIGDLRLDVADSAERLLAAFADFPEGRLEADVESHRGPLVAWRLPVLRRREVHIHHVDLGAGYGPSAWPVGFVTATLDELAEVFAERGDCPVSVLRDAGGVVWRVGSEGPTLVGPLPSMLAWLVGRSSGEDLTCEPPGDVPKVPAWL